MMGRVITWFIAKIVMNDAKIGVLCKERACKEYFRSPK
jgi:hypothetical protein